MDYAIKELQRNVKVLFVNRHDVGWGYWQTNQIKKYRLCQKRRRDELRSLIQGIRVLHQNQKEI